MSSDIVERLRGNPVRHDYVPEADRQEAADEIERLTAVVEALNTSLRTANSEIERLTRRLYEVDAQLTAEDHIHARECMVLRAEKDAEIEQLRAALAEETECARQNDHVLAKYEAALQKIADDGRNCADHCRRQARRALEPKP